MENEVMGFYFQFDSNIVFVHVWKVLQIPPLWVGKVRKQFKLVLETKGIYFAMENIHKHHDCEHTSWSKVKYFFFIGFLSIPSAQTLP